VKAGTLAVEELDVYARGLLPLFDPKDLDAL
jgi:hypothetical protein